MQVSEKTTENSERLGRQARLNLTPPVYQFLAHNRSATYGADSLTSMPYSGFELGTFGAED